MVCLVNSCHKVGDGLSTAVSRRVMVCLVNSCPKVGDGLSCQQLSQGG